MAEMVWMALRLLYMSAQIMEMMAINHITLIWTYTACCLRPPWGSLKLILTELINLVSLEQCHHKPMAIYSGGLLIY